ncbi:hypothetical protein Tco_1523274 [Tanacetum coccineum]
MSLTKPCHWSLVHQSTRKLQNIHPPSLPEILHSSPSAKSGKIRAEMFLKSRRLITLANVLASIIIQVLRFNQEILCMPGQSPSRIKNLKKSPKEIIRIKREQGEEETDSTLLHKVNRQGGSEEFDLAVLSSTDE